MSTKPIQVLVVDDSALLRSIICEAIAETDGLAVIGTARDGEEAIARIGELKPDVVTLDVLMPRLDGLEVLRRVLQNDPIPVIMVSAVTQRAAHVTLQALEIGALDYVSKPQRRDSLDDAFRSELVHKIRVLAGADVKRLLRIRRARKDRSSHTAQNLTRTGTAVKSPEYEGCCIALGISTGGPPALARVFQILRPPLPAMVIVQHMPQNFTRPFAQRLDSISALSIKEAEHGDILRPNCAFIAPGGHHLHLRKRGAGVSLSVGSGQPVSGHRPSIDVMMTDAAQIYAQRCLRIIMRGMGYDGAAGCQAIREAGGFVLGQDEATSDVYGMNKVAFQSGSVDQQFGLDELPGLLASTCRSRLAPVRNQQHTGQALSNKI